MWDQENQGKAELDLVRDIKNSKKTFYKYTGQKRQAKGSVPPLVNVKGKLASEGVEKAEALNEFFVLVFTGNQDSNIFHVPEPCIPKPLGREWGSKFHYPHCKGRASLKPPHETECVQVHGAGWHASRSSEGYG